MKIPHPFIIGAETYATELLREIEGSILFIKNFEGEVTEREYGKRLKFLETFVGNDKKSRLRKVYGIGSYMRVDFFFYPLKDLQSLSKSEWEKMNIYQNEVILLEIQQRKVEIQETEKKILDFLKEIKNPFACTFEELTSKKEYYFQ